jgi:hypothetical protein
MPRLSIARSLRPALVGLTLVLAAVAAVGVADLYNAASATRTYCSAVEREMSSSPISSLLWR